MLAPAIKLCLFASGSFLIVGLLTGVWKYRWMMTSRDHSAPVYVDIAHRASFLYSFAALVLAKLLEYSPLPAGWQLVSAGLPLFYFAAAIARYAQLGWRNSTANQFSERNFITTWGMYLLIAGEVLGIAAIFGGFIYTQVLQ